MRILLINDYGAATGGAEIAVLALRDGLRARGHEVRLFASSAGSRGAQPMANVYGFGTTSPFRTLLQTANPVAAASLAREIAAFRPDVAHVNLFLTQLSPLILPVLRGTPSVFHAHWLRAVCPTGTKMLPSAATCTSPVGGACLSNGCLPLRDWAPLMVQHRLWRRWSGVFGRIVANSEMVRGELLTAGLGPVEVLEYGLPQTPARPALSGPPSVIFAGRLVREKGVDTLLHAFAQVHAALPSARLTVAGDGPERVALTALAAELGVAEQVSFTGHISREALERLAAEAWVQVVPSRWREPFGLVAAEAMMRGTAVVASDAGGLREFIDQGETGLLVPGDAPAAWASALLTLLGDRRRAEALGSHGREAAQVRFDFPRYLDRILAVYEAARVDHHAATGEDSVRRVALRQAAGTPL
jgi:glycosyltransferase involved in cell wall biosynthesis